MDATQTTPQRIRRRDLSDPTLRRLRPGSDRHDSEVDIGQRMLDRSDAIVSTSLRSAKVRWISACWFQRRMKARLVELIRDHTVNHPENGYRCAPVRLQRR